MRMHWNVRKVFFCAVAAMMTLVVCVVSFAPAASGEEKATTAEKKNLYVGGDFDEWDWVPIPYNALKGLKKQMKAGIDLNCEIRGPLYRVPLGLSSSGPCGYMVEGPEAYKGRSIRMVANDPKAGFAVAQYLSNLRTNKRLRYGVFVKGKGKISLTVWLSGLKKSTGKFAWAGFPNIFSIEATQKWVPHTGTFTFPEPKDPDIILDEKVYARLVVHPGSDLMIDKLSVWEE